MQDKQDKPKGGKRPGAGRPPGSENKITKTLKDAILASFEAVGGEEYLERMAEEEPKAYMGLLGRVLPAEIKATMEHSFNKLTTEQKIEKLVNILKVAHERDGGTTAKPH